MPADPNMLPVHPTRWMEIDYKALSVIYPGRLCRKTLKATTVSEIEQALVAGATKGVYAMFMCEGMRPVCDAPKSDVESVLAFLKGDAPLQVTSVREAGPIDQLN